MPKYTTSVSPEGQPFTAPAPSPRPGRGASAPPGAGGVTVRSGMMTQMFESGYKSES
jgi:hypothetical protein